MTPLNQKEIDRYWAIELGTEPGFSFKTPGVYCTQQQLYSGLQLFQRDQILVVAAPPSYASFLTARMNNHAIPEIFTAAFVERSLVPDATKILGPVHVGYADDSTFRPIPVSSCRLLSSADAAQVEAFAATLSPAERDESDFHPNDSPAFGSFADGVLCAMARYEIWPPSIAQITVATHPDYRQRGHARAVVSALGEYALVRNLILQYRHLVSNESSSRLGHSLGFQLYASTLFARLKSAEANP